MGINQNDMDEVLQSLSELIRSLGRISNQRPCIMRDIDKERLNRAKKLLSKNTIIKPCEKLTQS